MGAGHGAAKDAKRFLEKSKKDFADNMERRFELSEAEQENRKSKKAVEKRAAVKKPLINVIFDRKVHGEKADANGTYSANETFRKKHSIKPFMFYREEPNGGRKFKVQRRPVGRLAGWTLYEYLDDEWKVIQEEKKVKVVTKK